MAIDAADPELPSPVTICLVEDHELLREQLCEFLAAFGFCVVAAVGSARDGQAAVIQHRPDVAVIDNRLPDGRGIDLIRTLALITPGVALLLHSGTVSDDDAQEARRAGAAAVITKSIKGQGLIEAIRSCRCARRP